MLGEEKKKMSRVIRIASNRIGTRLESTQDGRAQMRAPARTKKRDRII